MNFDAEAFLVLMGALSGAAHTLVDHFAKRRFDWLAEPRQDAVEERRRQSVIHVLAFLAGAVMAWSSQILPLKMLGGSEGALVNAVTAGLLASFGGGFFNEVVGSLREFKQAQAEFRKRVRE